MEQCLVGLITYWQAIGLVQLPFEHPNLRPLSVFDVTQPSTLTAIVDFWLPEFERHGTLSDAVRMIVGNKRDKVGCGQWQHHDTHL